MARHARAGAQPMAGAKADAADAVRAIVEEIRPTATAQGVELLGECRANELLEVACEPALLTIVLRNLVQNAVKYMPETGHRSVSVRALRVESMVRFEVEDTGRGVPEELRQYVFEPYRRGVHGGRPGMGLGLATVRRIVEAHGGRVSLEARSPGSLFRVDLPAASATAPPQSVSWKRLLRRALTVT